MSFETLHTLAIRGMAPPSALGDDVESLRANGFATFLERRGVWRITPAGRDHHAELLAADLAADRERLRPAYEAFLPLNHRFKALCTRWQTDGGRAEVADLGELHPLAAAVITDLAGVRPRFTAYRDRLAAALARVQSGEDRAFTGVLCDSYHDVWMELHRDLLLCLQIDRATEEAAGVPGTSRRLAG